MSDLIGSVCRPQLLIDEVFWGGLPLVVFLQGTFCKDLKLHHVTED